MADAEKDSGGSVMGFFKDVKLQLYERLGNPLLGSFAVSWLVWNHRLLAVLFSSMEVDKRFKYIDANLYASGWIAWLHWVAGPLACAFVYVFGYPHLAKWINGYWLRQQNELKKQRDEIDGATLLTQEESEKIRKEANRWVRDMEEENRRLRDQIQILKKEISDDEKPKAVAKTANDPFASQRHEIERRKIEIETAENDVKWQEVQERRRKAFDPSSSDPLSRLSEGTTKLLKHMTEKGGSVTRDQAKELFKTESAVRAEFYIDQAIELELVKEQGVSGLDTLCLTPKGRKYTVSRKLA